MKMPPVVGYGYFLESPNLQNIKRCQTVRLGLVDFENSGLNKRSRAKDVNTCQINMKQNHPGQNHNCRKYRVGSKE